MWVWGRMTEVKERRAEYRREMDKVHETIDALKETKQNKLGISVFLSIFLYTTTQIGTSVWWASKIDMQMKTITEYVKESKLTAVTKSDVDTQFAIRDLSIKRMENQLSETHNYIHDMSEKVDSVERQITYLSTKISQHVEHDRNQEEKNVKSRWYTKEIVESIW